MKTTRRITWLVVITSLGLGSTNLRADPGWSFAKLWSRDHQRTNKKQTSPFRTTSVPKATSESRQRSTQAGASRSWWPSLDSVASAPQRVWTRTKKLLAPADSRKAAANRSAKASRRHRDGSQPFSSRKIGDTNTLQDFLKQERPTF